MKFTIKRSIFVDHLNNVQRAISSRTTIPILTGIKIAVLDSGIILTGSDSTISIEIYISKEDESNQLSIAETGSIVLPSRFLGDIVKKLPEDQLTLEVQDNLQTVIRSGESVFNLNGTAGSEYPTLPEIDADSTYVLPGHLFKRVVNHTIISVSNQQIRPLFTGVHFILADEQLKAVSTDSHRLSQRIVPLTMPEESQGKALEINIPGQTLTELTRLVDDNEDIEMMVTDNQVLFKIDNVYLYSRLLEGNYPDTDRLLSLDYNTKIKVDAQELVHAVERALILSHQGKNNVVKLSLSQEEAILSGHSSEIGYVKEKLSLLSFEGDDLEISFNPDYLREALRSFGGQDVVIRFVNPTHSFILTPSEDEDEFNMVQLITPIRTPGN
ncbi:MULTISPECIES: DNA polymerase III subunit beta [Aerococcus]|uniref:DNA polymerase III subunit beta n=1 Tax=Aerococcus urinae (strain CCUG 59500 / ACS-120-V-Col10a) TaxID=2976812 RepID=UPI000200F9E2|nr:DNA polymerase III subunit beta [Aerococcus sp. Group 1]AEA01666.1 DNA polymerase III, beta subunit [Aerococcus sp. Group 1]MCY3030810.1 DNA polymerase III subunit beta [Aerococcus sp. Group 1]MCY3055794.1 DNA polymerase III subunit beta [Aerococcus sp. Group 1]MCY3057525.1 DNA polymerase III subunit beta [Aerococcus sp. Group 1]MCY3062723.1 DNA polymerase III subunit beta [Aerococcus sp. Group 1]